MKQTISSPFESSLAAEAHGTRHERREYLWVLLFIGLIVAVVGLLLLAAGPSTIGDTVDHGHARPASHQLAGAQANNTSSRSSLDSIVSPTAQAGSNSTKQAMPAQTSAAAANGNSKTVRPASQSIQAAAAPLNSTLNSAANGAQQTITQLQANLIPPGLLPGLLP